MTPRSKLLYWFCRFYCTSMMIAWFGAFALVLVKKAPFWAIFAIVPLFLPALFMLFNVGVFKFPYSLFGPFMPTIPSVGVPLEVVRHTSGCIGWVRATIPFVSWSLYQEGLLFQMMGVGRGFIPLSCVQGFQEGVLQGFTVLHSSAEVRSPVRLGSRRIYEKLKELHQGAPRV